LKNISGAKKSSLDYDVLGGTVYNSFFSDIEENHKYKTMRQ